MTLGKAFIGWYDKRLNPHAEVYYQQPGSRAQISESWKDRDHEPEENQDLKERIESTP